MVAALLSSSAVRSSVKAAAGRPVGVRALPVRSRRSVVRVANVAAPAEELLGRSAEPQYEVRLDRVCLVPARSHQASHPQGPLADPAG
jgi:hypothetical protein